VNENAGIGTPVEDSLAVSVGSEEASRRWRSLWRIHFWSGLFAMPFILLMATTGLLILYTQPVQDLSQNGLRKVDRPVGAEPLSLNEQAAVVEAEYPDGTVGDVTPPSASDRSTRFFVDDGSSAGLHVFVDPYSGRVLGDTGPGDGVIGLANRLHGHLNNDSVKIRLPAVAAIWDGGSVMREYVLGDLVLEILGIWTLVLVSSGMYIWWPRRGADGSRRRFFFRPGAIGRARWRDLHGVAGVLLVPAMLITIVSGMAWSTYWAEQFGSLADRITPGDYVDQPTSSLGERGDLDRFGNQIPWSTGEFPIPASFAPVTDGSSPAPLDLDAVAAIAVDEGMKPGFTITFPSNVEDEAGNIVHGSYAVYNSWPRKTGEARDLFLDQFTGETLAEQRVYGLGTVHRGMDYLVSTHMGTQLGIFSRIFMTMLCVLAIWSVSSAAVMYAKRRRPGTFGVPRRPIDVRLARGVAAIAVCIGIVFPQWGVVALIVLGVDRFLIRRVTRLRRAFGQVG